MARCGFGGASVGRQKHVANVGSDVGGADSLDNQPAGIVRTIACLCMGGLRVGGMRGRQATDAEVFPPHRDVVEVQLSSGDAAHLRGRERTCNAFELCAFVLSTPASLTLPMSARILCRARTCVAPPRASAAARLKHHCGRLLHRGPARDLPKCGRRGLAQYSAPRSALPAAPADVTGVGISLFEMDAWCCASGL